MRKPLRPSPAIHRWVGVSRDSSAADRSLFGAVAATQLAIWGNCYVEVVKDSDGSPEEYWLLASDPSTEPKQVRDWFDDFRLEFELIQKGPRQAIDRGSRIVRPPDITIQSSAKSKPKPTSTKPNIP